MDEDEEALLAELRAISAKSSATTRFSYGNDGNENEDGDAFGDNENDGNDDYQSRSSSSQNPRSTSKFVERSWNGGMNNQTFQNDHSSVEGSGLCPGISSGSGSDNEHEVDLIEARRIQSGLMSYDDDEEEFEDMRSQGKQRFNGTENENSVDPPTSKKQNLQQPSVPPPWRRSKKHVASHQKPENQVAPVANNNASNSEKKNSSTYQGERGGPAEDADLLAELRSIAANSAAANRFADSEDACDFENNNGNEVTHEQFDEVSAPNNSNNTHGNSIPTPKHAPPASTPPWRRGKRAPIKKNYEANVDVVVSAPSPPLSKPSSTELNVGESKNVVRGAFKSSLPSTFQGERGGEAEDPDLLAELKAISSNAAGANRFDETEQGCNSESDREVVDEEPNIAENEGNQRSNKNSSYIPLQKEKESLDAAPLRPSPEKSQTSGVFKSATPSTYQGERGGEAEDADLLAELRAISSNAASANRFDEADEEDNQESDRITSQLVEEKSGIQENERSQASNQSQNSASVPPWKRTKKGPVKRSDQSMDVLVAASPLPNPTPHEKQLEQKPAGFKSPIPSTFEGERGGAAEDEDLLAELRAISSKSAGANRFDETDQDEHEPELVEDSPHSMEPLQPPEESNEVRPLPPWKAGKRNVAAASENTAEVVGVASTRPNLRLPDADDELASQRPKESDSAAKSNETIAAATPNVKENHGGFKSSIPSTFKGERGGAADDAELLAELRAISSKSASADRFTEADEFDDELEETATEGASLERMKQPAPKERSDSHSLPPWKRGKRNVSATPKKTEVDVAVASPPRPNSTSTKVTADENFVSFKSSTPSTFKGERGGAAEDAELLAELRAISSKSASADRFAGDEDEVLDQDELESAGDPQEEISSGRMARQQGSKERVEPASLPPWKRDRTNVRAKCAEEVDVTVASPAGANTKSAEVTVPVPENFGGFKSSTPSTFRGERGGAAEDADLLAELRAISSKSASADRFTEADKDDGDIGESTTQDVPCDSPQRQGLKERNQSGSLPPWKTSKRNVPNEGVDIVVASPSKSNTTSSASADQFAEADEPDDGVEEAQLEVSSVKFQQAPKQKHESSSIPPWKRGKTNISVKPTVNVDVDVVVASPRANNKQSKSIVAENVGGFKSSTPSTFKGERGGAADDADLLAELRAISSKSASASRFTESNQDDDELGEAPVEDVARDRAQGQSATEKHESASLPPWKRGKKNVSMKAKEETDAVVASPPRQNPNASKGFKSSTPSTFTGERGGAAEDADLLAELKAISSKSASANRFVDAELEEEPSGDISVDEVHEQSSTQPSKPASLPPWKRGKKNVSTNFKDESEVVVAAPAKPPKAPAVTLGENFAGFKSSLPSTFKGERGGAAEDADLLAELRAISSSSSSANRFVETDGDGVESPEISEDMQVLRKKDATPRQRDQMGSVPPRKGLVKKSGETDAAKAPPARSVTAASGRPPEQTFGGLKSSLPSTFKGERGGAAEDADLLAELRAISAGSAGESRFAGGNDEDDSVSADEIPSSKIGAKPKVAQKNTSRAVSEPAGIKPRPATQSMRPANEPMSPAPGSSTEDDIVILKEDLPSSLVDKNWKVRKASYDFLHDMIISLISSGNSPDTLDSNSVVDGFDDIVVHMVADSNLGALDSAIRCSIVYAEHCNGAGSDDQARNIVSSLVKGSALAASRPSTAKLTSSLILKLMEVGHDGVASVHAVVEILLEQGVKAKKPKVVLTSASLILETAYAFGAASLPLALVSSSAPKMLSHSNAKVRDSGMKVIAEICRALGSKAPLQGLIDGMKTAQLSQLDSLLESQPEPTPVGVGFRGQLGAANLSPEDALAALQAGNKELEAQRLASRPEVNIFEELAKTDYSERIKLPKWSEKVAALNKVLECGGEKPYKLKQPTPSIKYAPLIIDMKKLLSHTHFAVCSKAMDVLAMLAEGVGEKLYPYLRPLLTTLLQLSKDKKLTNAVASCLDSFFGNVLSFEHLLDGEDSLPAELNESQQKNARARASAMEFLGRCVKRRETAGIRGQLSPQSAESAGKLCAEKLEDSDAGVRKAALEVLQDLQSVEDEEISQCVASVVEEIKKSNARAYKSLQRSAASKSKVCSKNARDLGQDQKPTKGSNTRPDKEESFETAKPAKQTTAPKPTPVLKNVPSKMVAAKNTEKVSAVASEVQSSSDIPNIDDALDYLMELQIPNWDAPEDENGVLNGLRSAKWMYRQNAIKSLITFINSGSFSSSSVSVDAISGFFLVVVKEYTKQFKEINVNITKAVIELFLALFEYHEGSHQIFVEWARKDAVSLAVDKLADKKLSSMAKSLLTGLCVVCYPLAVVLDASSKVQKLKSPVAHEELLKWLDSFCNDFGAASIGNGVSDLLPWLLEESKSKFIKVKTAALSVSGSLHMQLGPVFKALFLSQCKDASQSAELEKTFENNPFDPSSSSMERSKTSIALIAPASDDQSGDANLVSQNQNISLNIPRMDLFSYVPNDCANKMCSKDGKTAWKLRKEAIDQVDSALKKCSGLLDTSTPKMKELVDLVRALRERLSDSQSNLKPLAARVIGSFMSCVDKNSQAKFGKIVYSPLINAAINDIKKPMREAALEAIRVGTMASALEGGGINDICVETLASALVSELNDTSLKAGGLSVVLEFFLDIAGSFPNLDNITASHGQSLGAKFANAIVDCLTSSKSETRNVAESLLTACIKSEVVSLSQVNGCTERMKPAKQRTVKPILVKISRLVATEEKDSDEENFHSSSRHINEQPATSKPDVDKPVRRGSESSEVTKGKMLPPHPATKAPARANSPVPQRPKRGSISTNERFNESVSSGVQMEVSKHPLILSDKARSSAKSCNWPEFPEELSSPLLLGQLKKAWSPILPAPSIAAFFPNGGIRKQDDGKAGCELLSRAIEAERSGDGVAIEEQLEFILKWISYVLGSKEHTVGFQLLLSLLNDLFVYLLDIKYELSDSEAFILVPLLLEKGSSSKGRFRELFDDLLSLIKTEELLPPKRLGSVVCIPVMERSTNGKARAMACQECMGCVEKVGLSGIGKKGVLVAAKTLSEETLPENRSLSIDLMVLVLSRMNGDVQRLVKICGANLSEKARRLVEERWEKRGAALPTARQAGVAPPEQTRRSGIPSAIPTPSKVRSRLPPPRPRDGAGQGDAPSILRDELPALVLKMENDEMSNATDTSQFMNSGDTGGPFNLTLKMRSEGECDQSSEKGAPHSTGTSPTSKSVSPASIPSTQTDAESVGAAASLRARLLRIREKSKIPESALGAKQISPPPREFNKTGEVNEGMNASNRSLVSRLGTSERSKESYQGSAARRSQQIADDHQGLLGRRVDQRKEYEQGIIYIKTLLDKSPPLEEDDADLTACIEALKKFHAALSKQPNAVVGLSVQELLLLRQSIADNVNTTISHLTRLTRFAFDCEDTSRNAGISVPLLSVCLATLMALFRDHDLAIIVSAKDLALLIKETGTALLDPRLSVSSQAKVAMSLDEATSSQVVRAINKLAVQAATGGTRHSSLQALMMLQQELCFEPSSFNTRLSRVVTKLFSRVIKAEEGSPDPFQSDSLDFEALIGTLDDLFIGCNDAEANLHSDEVDSVDVCRNMAKNLVSALVRARNGVNPIRQSMETMGKDSQSSALGIILSQFASEEDDANWKEPKPKISIAEHNRVSTANSQPITPQKNAPAKDVAVLVSALGSAQVEKEKVAALDALRRYTSIHGDGDLNAHLEQVSSPFRDYVVEQLSESVPAKGRDELGSSSMSERLRSLRSRLHATEVVVQTAVKPSVNESSGSELVTSGIPQKSPSRALKSAIPKLSTSIPKPATSIPKPLTSNMRSYSAAQSDFHVQEREESQQELPFDSESMSRTEFQFQHQQNTAPSLRERLAAAQESRKTNFGFEPSAGGRAAALRARLEAVKQQSKQHS